MPPGGPPRLSTLEQFDLAAIDGLRLDAYVAGDPASTAAVLMVHAINSDADEEGGFVRLAEDLAEQGIRTLRFSFRAHGGSDGAGEALTVAGEQLDLMAAMRVIRGWSVPRLGIVASSFGAVPLLLSLDLLRPRPDALALWNPVLDVPGTFVSRLCRGGFRTSTQNPGNRPGIADGLTSMANSESARCFSTSSSGFLIYRQRLWTCPCQR